MQLQEQGIVNIIEKDGDLEFNHNIELVIEGAMIWFKTGRYATIEELALNNRDSFKNDIKKAVKAIARQRGHILQEQLDDFED